MQAKESSLEFVPATPERWKDVESLFGSRGACGGCWCMTWRLSRAEFNRQKGEANRDSLRSLVESGAVPGVLALSEGRPVGWCAVAPREHYVALARSRVLRPVDEQRVWSISCLFVAKGFRRKGLSVLLLQAAAEFAHSQGAAIVEGYPQELDADLPDAFVWTGLAGAFQKAGFVEVARRSPRRPIMRHNHVPLGK
ncbi:MAG TPA: GNAT family N-acetyltransferase [Acidisarcina sp.]|nr:GNAT family N-acetyltransferase [Acidisarcina sp.]